MPFKMEPRIALVGRQNLGGVQMRLAPLAWSLETPVISETEAIIRGAKTPDVTILCKYWKNGAELRRRSGKLIFDPLDCWSSNKRFYRADPAEFWRWCYNQLQFDAIIATSPACFGVMEDALSEDHTGSKVRVYLVPHPCDPRIGADWYDPKGPVVYGGGDRYLGGRQEIIARACDAIGKVLTLRVDDNDAWKIMKGASLVLHPRIAPHDTPLNRLCKPQVKAENAIAAGIPILGTDDPCFATTCPDAVTIPQSLTSGVSFWRDAMTQAIANGPLPRSPVRNEHYVDRMRQVIALTLQ